MIEQKMIEKLEALKDYCISDYKSFGSSYAAESERAAKIQEDMTAEYAAGFTWQEGKKYIKVISNRSVWGFIVNTTSDKKYPYGTVLKPAGWKAPARNFARGYIFSNEPADYARWTGVAY